MLEIFCIQYSKICPEVFCADVSTENAARSLAALQMDLSDGP
jgi:hypothetical protein